MSLRLSWAILFFVLVSLAGCAHVKPWERGRLAGQAMQFEFDPYADAAEMAVVGITEGGTFAGNGPGGAGAGCGCH